MRAKRGDGGAGCLIGCGVGALLMLLIPLMLLGWGRDANLNKPTGISLASGGGCNSPRLPKIADEAGLAQTINTYIAERVPSSPFTHAGREFIAAGRASGVSPIWMVTIAQKESSFGTKGIATKGTFNAFGRTASDSQPAVVLNGRRWYKYPSFVESLPDQAAYLKRMYLDRGLDTFRKIVYEYAPPEENDTEQYIKDVEASVGKLVALAGAALDCNNGGGADLANVPPGTNVGNCLNVREIPDTIQAKNNRLAQTTLVRKLELLWERNKTWRVTEGCPPTSQHADRNHYNGRAVDIAIHPKESATEEQVRKLLEDVRAIGFDDVLDEYHQNTTYKTGGHIHLEWHGK